MRYRRMKIEVGTYFFTLVTHGRQCILTHEPNVHLLRSSFRHVKANHPFVIGAIVVLPDHLHCIWGRGKGGQTRNLSQKSKTWNQEGISIGVLAAKINLRVFLG